MLLDNKTRSNENDYFKVFDLLADYVETGRVDIVTGYFSASAIAKLSNEINNAKSFRMILGNLLQAEAKDNKTINLLSDSLAVDQSLFLSVSACFRSESGICFIQCKTKKSNNLLDKFPGDITY